MRLPNIILGDTLGHGLAYVVSMVYRKDFDAPSIPLAREMLFAGFANMKP